MDPFLSIDFFQRVMITAQKLHLRLKADRQVCQLIVFAAQFEQGGIPAYVTSRIPKVLDSTTYTDVSGTRTFSFSDAAITTTSRIDYYANVFGVAPQSVTLSSGSLTVDFYTADGVTECAVEIK